MAIFDAATLVADIMLVVGWRGASLVAGWSGLCWSDLGIAVLDIVAVIHAKGTPKQFDNGGEIPI